jgi:hypothetical protein
MNIFNKSKKKVEKIAEGVANKVIEKSGMGTDNTQENLAKYSEIVLGTVIPMTKIDPTGTALNMVRNNIQTNLPPDIMAFIKEGKTKEQIMEFYWGVPKFVELFAKLGWNKQTLETMVDNELK